MRVLTAGSLLVPFDQIEEAFEAAHPGVDVLIEGHGSIQCVRHVTELNELADVVAVADEALIPMLMGETIDEETGAPYADWHVQFATNRLGLAYTSQSVGVDQITPENWYQVVSRPEVLLGLSDPRLDACGYRGLMATQLAEGYYGDDAIFESVLSQRFRQPVRIRDQDGTATILVPEVLQPVGDSGLEIRGSSVRLLGLLESGDLDYGFEYESVSRQHGLGFLPLPGAINLSDEAYAADYERVQVELDFQRFASVDPIFVGKPIAYGITIPTNAPHPNLAAELVAFILGPEGQAIMAGSEHPTIQPPIAVNPEALPDMLKDMVE